MPIEQLVARGGGELGDGGGQFVVSRDQHDPAGELVTRRISRTYQRMAYVLRVLTLRVTEELPFYRAGEGWTPAKSLAADDILLGAQGTLTVVLNDREAHPAGVAVYNLEVAGAHTYFVLAADAGDAEAETVWAHNANYPTPRVHDVGQQVQNPAALMRLRNVTFDKGRRQLEALGLRAETTATGRVQFVDQTGFARVAFDRPAKGPAHWHKFHRDEFDRTYQLSDRGYVLSVDDLHNRQARAHIRAGG